MLVKNNPKKLDYFTSLNNLSITKVKGLTRPIT
jgi:hypothetical protein